jgi:hypothetical protein
MGSLNCNELKMKKYTLLLIWVYLALASCGSPKNLGPSFGGGDEMPELISKVESKEQTIAEVSEGSGIVIETKGDVKSSSASEVIDRPIHRINYQKNVLVQPMHHAQSLLLDSHAIDSNQLAFKKWTRVTNWGKLVFLAGLLSLPIGIYSAFFITAIGLFLMVYGSKKRHKYKPIIESHDTGPIPNTNTVSVPPIAESQNTGPTPNSNAVSESPELRVLRQKKDNLGLMCLMSSLFAFGILFMSEMSGGGSSASENIITVALLCILSFLLLIAFLQANMEFEEKRKALLEEDN